MPPELPLTTGPSAARAHRRGVAHLLSGAHEEAVASFREAIAEDPCFAVGHASLAVALATLDDHRSASALDALGNARRCSRQLSRRERHHVELVLLTLEGRTGHAAALGQEHLSEFPDDEVAGYVLQRWCTAVAEPSDGQCVD